MPNHNHIPSRIPRAKLARPGLCLAFTGALLLTGCKSTKQPKASAKPPSTCERVKKASWPLQLFVRPSRKMNASPDGRPLDTQIQILQVSSLDRLNDVSIRKLWNATQEVVGPDLLSVSRQTVRIRKGIDLKLEIKSGARFVVVLAWLRNPAQDSFWSAIRLPLGYQVGACTSELPNLPAPCAFASIGQGSVSMGLEPQVGFNTSGIQARCPSLLLLHSSSNDPV